MFRREKDAKLDNEGLRRMREAIRQRLDEDEVGTDSLDQEIAPFEPPTGAPAGGEGYAGVAPFTVPTAETDLTWGRLNRSIMSPDDTLPPQSAPEPTRSSAQSSARPDYTTIAADTLWRGTLRSTESILIEGTFIGEIETEAHLEIRGDGQVEATVRAGSILVAGQLNGNVVCRDRLEVLEHGRVSGQIQAGRLAIHEGAHVGGQLRMRTSGEAGGGEEAGRPMLQRVR